MMKRTLYICLVALVFQSPMKAQQLYSLEECRQMALEQNAKMKVAANKAQMAKQEKREAVTNFFPSISLTGGAMNADDGLIRMPMGEQTMKLLDEGTFGGAMVTMPIFAGGQIYHGNKLAKLGVELSELQLRQTRNEVTLTVDQYYWNIVVLNEKLKTLQHVSALLEKICSDAKAAVDAGIKNRNDLLQVELRKNETQSVVIDIQNNIAICKMLLAQYIGTDMNSFDVQTAVSTELRSPEHLYVNHNERLETTVEYQLLSKAVDASKLEKRLNTGQFLPTVALQGGYLYNDFMGPSQNSFVGMLNVSIPISWKAPFSVRKYKLRHQNAVTEFNNGSEQLMIRMQKAQIDLSNAYQQALIALNSIEQSEENLRLNEQYYKAGTSGMSDLLEAQQLYQQSRDNYAEAYSKYEISKTEYLQATGR
ncbi:MAG: TolC family protein [Bacteroidales bacterium]|nr:TolC family protein [Bacteroidales bacterium]